MMRATTILAALLVAGAANAQTPSGGSTQSLNVPLEGLQKRFNDLSMRRKVDARMIFGDCKAQVNRACTYTIPSAGSMVVSRPVNETGNAHSLMLIQAETTPVGVMKSLLAMGLMLELLAPRSEAAERGAVVGSLLKQIGERDDNKGEASFHGNSIKAHLVPGLMLAYEVRPTP